MNFLFGDNINTDLITPGRYNMTTDPQGLAKIVFIEYRPEFSQQVQPGDFVIGGSNFGCGSSRETAATGLKATGIQAVIAKSFARIFYRNCLNQGLLAIIANTDNIHAEDRLELDIQTQEIVNLTQNQRIPAQIPEFMLELNRVGGILEYIKLHGTDNLEKLFNPA